jgi:hypothetical protein
LLGPLSLFLVDRKVKDGRMPRGHSQVHRIRPSGERQSWPSHVEPRERVSKWFGLGEFVLDCQLIRELSCQIADSSDESNSDGMALGRVLRCSKLSRANCNAP